MTADPVQESRTVLARALVASGIGFIVAGIFVGLWQGEIFFLIAAVGVVDLVLAWAFQTGRLGGAGVGEQPIPATETEPSGADVIAGEATDDPNYNPHARED